MSPKTVDDRKLELPPTLTDELVSERRSTVHIGLIGGIGPAATEFYYRGLVKAHASKDKSMDLTIVHADIRDLIRNATNGAGREQAELYHEFVKRLQSAGADAVAVTSLGGHFCIEELEAISPLPVINAIPIIDAYLTKTKETPVTYYFFSHFNPKRG